MTLTILSCAAALAFADCNTWTALSSDEVITGNPVEGDFICPKLGKNCPLTMKPDSETHDDVYVKLVCGE